MNEPVPKTNPIEMVPTDVLLNELKRRCHSYCIAVVVPVEQEGGGAAIVPTLTWGSRSRLAHEALGLAHQLADVITIEARNQMDIGKQGVEEHFRGQAHARRTSIAPLSYTYVPPGTPPGTQQ